MTDKRALTPEEIVADMVTRFKKWNARGTPLPVIMNKILVNIQAQLTKIDKLKLDRPELTERMGLLISAFVGDSWQHMTPEMREEYETLFAQILALIPDEEEIRKQERREVGEWLEKRSMKGEGSFAKIVLSQGDANVYRKDIEALKQGKLGEK